MERLKVKYESYWKDFFNMGDDDLEDFPIGFSSQDSPLEILLEYGLEVYH